MSGSSAAVTVTSVPPRPSGAVTAETADWATALASAFGAMSVVLTVRFVPLVVCTWTGGSSRHHAMLATPALAPATSIAPAATTPPTTLLAFMVPLSPLFRTESVPQPSNRVNEPRRAVQLQLLPDARNVDLERVRLRARRDRPDRLCELRVGDELAARPHQRGEDAELDAGQAELAAAARRPPVAEVDDDVARDQARPALAPMAADDRLDASHELLEREGLGDVVVGALLQARDPVADRRLGADAHERGVGL